jgi:plasmid stabilization system protein ParE
MRIVFLPEASAELAAAAEWYQERQLGLGDDFLEEVGRATGAIAEAPDAWPALTGARRPVRRFLLSRFPFSVVYAIRDEQVLVVAVAHAKRRPRYWSRRLADR